MNEIKWPAIFCLVGLWVWILVMALIMMIGVDFKMRACIFFAMTSSFNAVCSIITYYFDEISIEDRRFMSILFMSFSAILFIFCYKLFNGKFNRLYWPSLSIFGLINFYGIFYLVSKMKADNDYDEDFDW